MLLGNYSALNSNPGREVGSAYTNPYQWMKGGTLMNWFIGEQWDVNYTKKNSLPTGTEAPYAFRMAIVGGELSSSTGISGSSSVIPVSSLGVSLAADLAGTGDLEGTLNLTSSLAAALAGVGDLDGSLRGTANLEATILVNPGAVTTQEIASAVWDAVAVDNDVPGTMGEKLNAAGTAGDPWTTDLTSYNVPGSAGKKLKDNLTQNNFLGLK